MQGFTLVLVAVGVVNVVFRVTGDSDWVRVVGSVCQLISFVAVFGLTVLSRRQNHLGR